MVEFVGLVNNVGFPIAVSLMLYRQYRREREHRRDERENWRQALERQADVLADIRREVRTDRVQRE
jgi:hypothetical protein